MAILIVLVADLHKLNESFCLWFEILIFVGEVVMAVVVGTVVTIVAILMWFMIMTLSRALIAFLLTTFGLSGIALILGLLILVTMKFGQVSFQLIWTVFIKSCN